MEEDRSTEIRIDGQSYSLLLTTRAVKQISERYGGLEHFGEALQSDNNAAQNLCELVWLLVLLANQSIEIYNRCHPEAKKELLTEKEVELLTTPAELMDFFPAILEAIRKGMGRNVLSEDTGKNTQAG